jgi:5'-3' exonuclease
MSGGRALVATGDRDAFQLASEKTTILQPIKAGELARIGPAEVVQRYGIEPRQVPDFIAWRGDPSDKIPGAAGVGAKTAAALLRKYGSLEEVLTSGSFPTQAKQLRLYRSIATMNKTAPVPVLRDQKPSRERSSSACQGVGLEAPR